MRSVDVMEAEEDEFWEPRMRASMEMTEQLASEIHEEVQELRKEMKEMAAKLEESVKKLLNNMTKSGE
jgi:DNA-binding protein H-NS